VAADESEARSTLPLSLSDILEKLEMADLDADDPKRRAVWVWIYDDIFRKACTHWSRVNHDDADTTRPFVARSGKRISGWRTRLDVPAGQLKYANAPRGFRTAGYGSTSYNIGRVIGEFNAARGHFARGRELIAEVHEEADSWTHPLYRTPEEADRKYLDDRARERGHRSLEALIFEDDGETRRKPSHPELRSIILDVIDQDVMPRVALARATGLNRKTLTRWWDEHLIEKAMSHETEEIS
jgi:hypothetical protein